MPARLVVGITGATGAIYAHRLLQRARSLGAETHLVVTPAGVLNLHHELGLERREVEALADHSYSPGDVGACLASGSFDASAMVIAPCSIKTLSAIANSFNTNLLIRAADVCLKERRKLVLMLRETPLHLGHLRLMTQVTEAGAVLVPPLPAFYHKPKTLEDVIMQSVNKALDQFDLDLDLFKRWTGNEEREALRKK